MWKLGIVTTVNMGLGVLKDKYFAQVFSGTPVTNFPAMSWGLFVARDLATVGAGFILPAMAAQQVHKSLNIPEGTATKYCQFVVPMSCQLLLTPIHLLALDCYNNKTATAINRVGTIKSIYVEATGIRFGRVLFAYGIAGVANTGLRSKWREEYLK